MVGFKSSTNANTAVQLLLKRLKSVTSTAEEVSLHHSLDRIASENIISKNDIPMFDKSSMDGYAVLAEDTFSASETNPSILKIVGKVNIGTFPSLTLKHGEAAEIATGGYTPKGATAVVIVENSRKLSQNRVQVVRPVVPSQNISRLGEDVKIGQVVLRKGVKVKPQDIGLLAELGISRLKVIRKPKVAVISTGNEIIDITQERRKSKIFDVNRHMTMASVIATGGEPLDMGIVKDEFEAIKNLLLKSLSLADIVIVSAGTSVGEKDLVPDVLDSLDSKGLLLHGVSIKPGYPTGIAIIKGKPVISLPGFPVSNFMAFKVIAKPLIAHMLGTKVDPEPSIRARMVSRVTNSGGFRVFVRVKIIPSPEGFKAEPLAASGSGILTSLTNADGIVTIPEDREGLDEDEVVEVTLLRPIG